MNHPVKYKSVSVTVFPWKHPSGREYWRFKANGKAVTRNTLEKAKRDALKHCQTVYRGSLDLSTITPEQSRAVRRMLEADPTCRLIDEFLEWQARKPKKKKCHEAIAEFLKAKQSAAGNSKLNVTSLRQRLYLLPDVDLGSITVNDLPPLTGAPRTRKNIRAAWVTFFKWCRDREWLPYGVKTAPERLDRPVVTRKVPATYTPAELRILLVNVRPQYLPWLALAAFAGLRTEEVIPQQGSDKPPLEWEDIRWDQGVIVVRAETAKTGDRRIVPIQPALRAWLFPVRGEGVIGPHLYPSKPSTHGSKSETARLGALIGGWKRNALRHSYISFRAAICGISQTAMEAGNSESEARRSYNDAKTREEAEAWFNVHPVASSESPGHQPTTPNKKAKTPIK